MIFAKSIAAQLRKPSGLLGPICARAMNSMNASMNAAAVEHLVIHPDDYVLDIGFGGGVTLSPIVRSANRGLVVGMELSESMLSRAHRQHQCWVEQGKLLLTKGSVETISFRNECFDKICTINTVYFWTNPVLGMRNIFRVQKIGGTFVLGFRPAKELQSLKFDKHGFITYEIEQLRSLLTGIGFQSVCFDERNDGSLGFMCAIARKW